MLGDRSARPPLRSPHNSCPRARRCPGGAAPLQRPPPSLLLDSRGYRARYYAASRALVGTGGTEYRAATEALTSVRADAAKAGWPGLRGSGRDRARLGEPAHRRGRGRLSRAAGRRRAAPCVTFRSGRRTIAARRAALVLLARVSAGCSLALRRRGSAGSRRHSSLPSDSGGTCSFVGAVLVDLARARRLRPAARGGGGPRASSSCVSEPGRSGRWLTGEHLDHAGRAGGLCLGNAARARALGKTEGKAIMGGPGTGCDSRLRALTSGSLSLIGPDR